MELEKLEMRVWGYIRLLKRIWLIGLLLMSGALLRGQDLHFSQFYAAPLFLSPSLAGGTGGGRAVMNYRHQWPAVTTAFTTSSFSVDNYFSHFQSGLGFMIVQDKAGSADLTFTQMAFQYSYHLQLMRDWQFIPALQFGYGSRALDFTKLVFADEAVTGGASGAWERLAESRVDYVDFAVSGLVHHPLFWVGFTIDHLLEPRITFLDEEMFMGRKYVVFGGLTRWNHYGGFGGDGHALSWMFRFQKQEAFRQMDIGMNWYSKPFEAGLWYRGLPFLTDYPTQINHDALILQFGYRYDAFRVGYSYDLTLSSLGFRAGGSHEISIIYEFNQPLDLGGLRRPAVPCSDISNPLIRRPNKYERSRRRLF